MRGNICVWMRGKGDMRVYVCAHVNDLLIVGKPEAVRQLKKDMETKYTMVWTVGKQHSYQGHRFAQNINITEGLQRRHSQKVRIIHRQKQPKLNSPCNPTIFLTQDPNTDVSIPEAKRIEYEEGTPILSNYARRSLYVSAVM
jgi:hypothetical protein